MCRGNKNVRQMKKVISETGWLVKVKGHTINGRYNRGTRTLVSQQRESETTLTTIWKKTRRKDCERTYKE